MCVYPSHWLLLSPNQEKKTLRVMVEQFYVMCFIWNVSYLVHFDSLDYICRIMINKNTLLSNIFENRLLKFALFCTTVDLFELQVNYKNMRLTLSGIAK